MLHLNIPATLSQWPAKPKILPMFLAAARAVYPKVNTADSKFPAMVGGRNCSGCSPGAAPKGLPAKRSDRHVQKVDRRGRGLRPVDAYTKLKFDRKSVAFSAIRLSRMHGPARELGQPRRVRARVCHATNASGSARCPE